MNYPTQPERLTTAPMTWTDATPTEEGFYVFVNAMFLDRSEPLRCAEIVLVDDKFGDGLSVCFEGVLVAVTDLSGKWLKIEPPSATLTASKTAPSPAGSWRKAAGILSKSQGQ